VGRVIATWAGAADAGATSGGKGAGGGVREICGAGAAGATATGWGAALKGGNGAGGGGAAGLGALEADASRGMRDDDGFTGRGAAGSAITTFVSGAIGFGATATGLGIGLGIGAGAGVGAGCRAGLSLATVVEPVPPLRSSSSVYFALSRSATRLSATFSRSDDDIFSGAFSGTSFKAGKLLASFLTGALAIFRSDFGGVFASSLKAASYQSTGFAQSGREEHAPRPMTRAVTVAIPFTR
jgi:hypothetical protein